MPFVGRAKELAQLQRLHAQRKHVLILGPAGVGKSALIQHAASSLPVLVCPQSERLSDICNSLESQLGLDSADQKLVQRKQRLLQAITQAGSTVVFDGVGWATPKVCSLLNCVSERVPAWICSRSDFSWDIGHLWVSLSRFMRVELHPFRLADTRAMVEAAVQSGQVGIATLDAVEHLHRLAAGIPQVLCELLEGLATGRYDAHKLFDLRLLNLDRRIQHLATTHSPRPA